MKKALFLITFITSALLVDCTGSRQQASEETSGKKADEIVDRAITWAGGLDRWKKIEHLSYSKRSRLLFENQEVENDISQLHDYTFSPMLIMDVNWVTNGDNHSLRYADKIASKFINDSLVDAGQKVKESALSALYVLGMPFKLKDQGTFLTYEGQKVFRGKTTDIIKATYSPKEHDNHSTSDVWWYFFDVDNGAYLGCMVYHAPTYALIENIAFHEVEGMKFQKRRMSYRCDSLGNKKFLRAEFWYDDYQVAFRR